MIRILVTGSRNWDDLETMIEALAPYDDYKGTKVLVHGCAKGADTMAAYIALSLGWEVEGHPADWDTHGKAAGHIRNHQMVKLGADVCLAFPLGESRGTRGCMKAAEKAGIKVINYGDSSS